MKRVCILISLVGALVLVLATQMPAYKNEAGYQAAYLAIDSNSPDAFTKFSELRKSSLTNRFLFEDYAFILLSLGAIGAFVIRQGDGRVYSPKSKLRIAALGLLCVAMSAFGLFGSMFLGLSRGDYPHWADSAGIGVVENSIAVAMMLIWMALHLFYLKGRFASDRRILLKPSLKTAWLFLLAIFFFTALVISIIQADALMVPALALWTYFFASLMAGASVAETKHA